MLIQDDGNMYGHKGDTQEDTIAYLKNECDTYNVGVHSNGYCSGLFISQQNLQDGSGSCAVASPQGQAQNIIAYENYDYYPYIC
jgi:hypothetical protein